MGDTIFIIVMLAGIVAIVAYLIVTGGKDF